MSSEVGALPVVAAWRYDGDHYTQLATLTFDDLMFYPQDLAIGEWSLSLPWDDAAKENCTKDRYYTVDWRGRRFTWACRSFNPDSGDQTGRPTLQLAGAGALDDFNRPLVRPNPALGVNDQPVLTEDDPAPYHGPAETVIRRLVDDNYRGRFGTIWGPASGLVLQPDLGRGDTVYARPQMTDHLLPLLLRKARRGGLTIDVGLVNDGSSTRAQMTLLIGQPTDRSASVVLKARLGALASWSQTDTAPSATRMLVSGYGNDLSHFYQDGVTTAASRAAETSGWGVWEEYVAGPSSFDPDELTEAGQEALDDATGSRTLSLTAAETTRSRAFEQFDVSDVVAAEVIDDQPLVDVVSGIKVEVGSASSGGSPITVSPVIGDPNATDADDLEAEAVRAAHDHRRLKRRVDALEGRGS